MLGAVGRLPPLESPSRLFVTTRHLADSSEVEHQAALEIALVASAHSRCTLGRYTPARSSNAGVMRAVAGICFSADTYVGHAAFIMFLAVHPRLLALDVVGCLTSADGVSAAVATDVHHVFFRMLTAVYHHLAALHFEAGHPSARIM